ncbi:ribosomal protein L38e [Tritrichomonas foetus]|uniref:Ribosomal protein L38e n=1 Tax=Tritrichomonas foetus TaxID=1144522 RepID=A0A1J4L6B1_9EUKA|nr:ribosomal protein L38e [Tritrichomonas foetus]|eukprot:OHT17486.1 ribosomal protein L38e [Tritrichomonas foetus]
MPKSVSAPKKFLELVNRSDAKWVKIKKVSADVTKFKLRTTKYLYTLTIKQPKFTQLVTESIPQGLEVIYLDKRE